MHVEVEIQRTRWRADLSRGVDLSIPLRFDAEQPCAFGAAAAASHVVRTEIFVGEVAAGGSCNCSTYTLTPHCNGTHTECVGHITRERLSIRDVAPKGLILATLMSVQPIVRSSKFAANDQQITAELLQSATARLQIRHSSALIVRTLPNSSSKLAQNYDHTGAPYFTVDAIQWMVQQDIRHLICDLPSIDRMQDGGVLAGHRAFWGLSAGSKNLSAATRNDATITELAFVADDVTDGDYLLDLQIAPFATDAAPSRPIIFSVTQV